MVVARSSFSVAIAMVVVGLLYSLGTSRCAHVTDSWVVLRRQIYDNFLNGMNPQDNSDGMTISDNHVSDAASEGGGCPAGLQESIIQWNTKLETLLLVLLLC